MERLRVMNGKRRAIHPLLRPEPVPRPWMWRRRLGVVSQAAIAVDLTLIVSRSERARMFGSQLRVMETGSLS